MPGELIVVRHAESVGNVARAAALAAGSARIPLDRRDRDVPLSALGEEQARAGAWWRASGRRPDVAYSSPYVRAEQTARIALRAADWPLQVVVDERLREKSFGELDGLTARGVRDAFPQEAATRVLLGKMRYRAPGGESWSDVVARVHDFCRTRLAGTGGTAIVVTHQVVVLCFRAVLENLDDATLLAIDRSGDVANCGIARYGSAPLDCFAVPVTVEPSAARAQ